MIVNAIMISINNINHEDIMRHKKPGKFGIILTYICIILLMASVCVYAYYMYLERAVIADIYDIDTMKEEELDEPKTWSNENKNTDHALLEQPPQADYLSIYEKEGIKFISYSESWDESKLIELADELFSNVHGDEIYYVAKVELYDGENEQYSGYHTISYENFPIPLSFYKVLPKNMQINMSSGLSVIVLTNADTRVTVDDMARTLSHEYGHHFVKHHFKLFGNEKDFESDYYKLRAEDDYIIYNRYDDWDLYLENHMWYLAEIAAEDYFFLMGSKRTQQVIEFYDAKEKVRLYAMDENKYDDADYFYKSGINFDAHENPVLRLPSQVPGLSGFFYSAISMEPPAYEHTEPVGTLNLTIEKISSKRNKATWDKPDDGEDVIYTLLIYDESDELYGGIKTIHGDERARAYIGQYSYDYKGYTYTFDDGIMDLGHVRYRVSIVYLDGSVVLSDPVDVEY